MKKTENLKKKLKNDLIKYDCKGLYPTKLGELIETNTETYSVNEGWNYINYLDTGNITDNHIDEIYEFKVGIDKIPSRAKRKVKDGDIIYSTVRPNQKHFGIIKSQPTNFLVSTGFTTIRAKLNKADSEFIYWYLSQPAIIEFLQGLGETSTSAYPSIKPSDIEALELLSPPVKEQKSIASILGALDYKIKNNSEMNETLEDMAHSIFKSWFVDYDPVYTKATGKIPDHMDSKTFDLFPNSFGSDGVPVGWKVLNIGSVVEVHRGLSYKGKFLSDNGVNMVNLGCFGFKGTFKAEKIKNYNGDYKDRHKIEPGDLIFANTDMTQNRAILCSPVIVPNYIISDETIFSHHVSRVNVLKSQHPAFLQFLRQSMMTQNFRMRAEGYATGTTVLAVPKNIFDGYYIPIPSNEILDVFYKFISNISKKLKQIILKTKLLLNYVIHFFQN